MRCLLHVLREDFGFTGTKYGCGEGECGACTVLLDGDAVTACLVPVAQVEGRDVVTVEGLAGDPECRELRRAFLEEGAAQCGICTPGMLVAAAAYLGGGGGNDESAIREALAGNLCRCTGYVRIVEAVARAAADEGRPERSGTERPASGHRRES
jgi:aerobic-type carbon monoxide dehydrogenase small subunit (CoxS/CutS family)